MNEQLLAQLSELPYVEGSPWREDRVQLVDPNTQELVCSLASGTRSCSPSNSNRQPPGSSPANG